MARRFAAIPALLLCIIDPSAAQDVHGVDRVVVVDAAGRAEAVGELGGDT